MLNRDTLTAIRHLSSRLSAPGGERAACTLYPLPPSRHGEGIADPGAQDETIWLRGKQPWIQPHLEQARQQTWHPAAVPLNEDARHWRAANPPGEDEHALLGHALATLLYLDETTPAPPRLQNADYARYRQLQTIAETRRTLACRRLVWALNLPLSALEPLPVIHRMDDWQNRRHLDDRPLTRLVKRVAFGGVLLTPALLQGLALARQAGLSGITTLFGNAYRDASAHLAFELALYEQLRDKARPYQEQPLPETLLACIREALELATEYAYDSQPRGLLGLNAPMLEEHLRFTANACCRALRLPEPCPDARDPLGWLTRPAGEIDPT
ncbi:ribonucleotide-diphosphate reductase subunit beta [endosymbiont of unidentified scaly snail isolate Monju]|uniref:ribonucleotide-diphosphate reductase subunit beta n=1 Tax=endosymbiont of unidentified scaly snail isolate Monju TaxID=1248727 RepID=UPI0003891DC0|nr:ribonucleotide-diphosphate reductase subunit beta [endosymbiont of unidentified scaly snail isolate Monju]BAN68585.1 hypothetical protein EBS_0624 [endosymbiont of unidentified scaly snail isolate Monju]